MVALVGAGPGDPGLITRLGAELLAQADLVLYDRLVSPEILELAQIARSMVCVDQLPGCHPDRIGAIGKAMVEAAQNGLRVVRLKGGDPILFGRCLEEVEPLIEQGISYQIVPGVTAALGAAAFAGIPVTDRRLASAVALITGHENPTKTDGNLDWQALARFPGTLVFYMAMARLENMTTRLMGHGKSPDTPACIIAQATLPSQRVLVTTLGELVAKARAADLRPPAICMVGPVVDCRATMNWFDRRPLYGKRVLTCRPNVPEEKFGNSLVNRLRALGASARNIPTLEIVPTAEIGLPGLSQGSSPQWDWVVFSSQPGVQSFFAQLHQLGLDSRALAGALVAAVGEQTARALAQHGIRADCTNPGGNAESLAKQLLAKVQGRAVLLVRADRGREVLAQTLQPVCRMVECLPSGESAGIECHRASVARRRPARCGAANQWQYRLCSGRGFATAPSGGDSGGQNSGVQPESCYERIDQEIGLAHRGRGQRAQYGSIGRSCPKRLGKQVRPRLA